MFIELDNKERDNNYTLWRSNEDGERIRRHKLRDILPLDVPLSIDIEASSVCCLKCKYCPQSLEQSKKKDINIGQNGFMDYVLFRRLIDQLGEFPYPLKNIRFAGFGEPLLNRSIVDMVAYAKKKAVAETITVVTNGIPLNKDISSALAKNVDTVLFDIQGMCAEDYEKWCDTEIDFNSLIENISYLRSIMREGKVFCKTFKSIIVGREREFFEMFRDISHEIAVDDIYEIYPEIDYSDMVLDEKISKQYNAQTSIFCAYPWYQMAIDASGRVTACTLPVSKSSRFLVLGNVGSDSLLAMWNGEKLNQIRYKLLKERHSIMECKNCKYTNLTPNEDRIDEIVDALEMHCDRFLRGKDGLTYAGA